MENNLFMDFSVDKENHSIKVEREFAAALPKVWDAYTKSEYLDQWWAPKPWKAKTKSMDFRPGGRWMYAMVGPEGEEHWAVMDYLTIQDQKGYTAVDAFADSEGNINTELPQSKWDASFETKGENTLVTSVVVYEDLAQLEAILQMGMKEGLTMAMEGLDELLVAQKIKV
ncbi:SRPBCC family protein [Pedobacter nyackensis]|uniref:Uncharacterized conserved protein YndB, AHSA1/START domain n=1 Tax=Pedobacter nyackensis TaxID=475255 RepID=A0A1W2DLE0_9SPHI|nr:SRPBCC domain-containing protein [Pedobacter nyackensis]SMC98320.1 Uncharacterized conserved protein YndB, AHSA1/START domain [Pedobacter nyackensis]